MDNGNGCVCMEEGRASEEETLEGQMEWKRDKSEKKARIAQ